MIKETGNRKQLEILMRSLQSLIHGAPIPVPEVLPLLDQTAAHTTPLIRECGFNLAHAILVANDKLTDANIVRLVAIGMDD